jgi:hypothetical protein
MSTLTGGDLNLVKPALTDDHKVTIGTDLPANFQKIDDEFTAHLADAATHLTTGNQIFSGVKTISGKLNGAFAVTSNGQGAGLFVHSYSLILLYAVDKTVPGNYILAMGYKGLQGTDTHTLNIINSNVLTLGAKNHQGTQNISGGEIGNIITYGISIPI